MRVSIPQHDGVAPMVLRCPRTKDEHGRLWVMSRQCAVPVDDAVTEVAYAMGSQWRCYVWHRGQGLVPVVRATHRLSRS